MQAAVIGVSANTVGLSATTARASDDSAHDHPLQFIQGFLSSRRRRRARRQSLARYSLSRRVTNWAPISRNGDVATREDAKNARDDATGPAVRFRDRRRFRYEPKSEGEEDDHAAAPTDVPFSEHREPGAIPVVGYAAAGMQDEQLSDREFEAQAEMIVAACERRGLSLLELVREREPWRGDALERPGLGYALELIAAGEAEGLVVAELSRLTHSVPDLGRVLERLSRLDARLVAAGSDLDTGAEDGRLTVRAIMEISQWEQERLI